MACTGRYAEAWQFSALFCPSTVLKGTEKVAGSGHVSLTDTWADFISGGVRANEGMVVYNLTAGTYGPVTAVTTTTLTATGVTWSLNDQYRIAILTGMEIAALENALDIAANDIHPAIAAVDACNCTLQSWANGYLGKLNIIDAAAVYNCSCGNTRQTDEWKALNKQWIDNQLELIRTGKIELCSGATGAEYPAIDWAEQSTTEFAAARIISNDIDRNS